MKTKIKSVINPGISWRPSPAPDPRLAIASQLVETLRHHSPALQAAYERERAAVRTRIATIERISDGPRDLGWHYVAAPGTPQSLLRTGWHAVGEPCPREVFDAILQEIADAREAWRVACAPIRAAALAAGLSESEGPAACRAQNIAARVLWAGMSSL